MPKRLLSHLIFWPLISIDIAVSAIAVVLVYFPLVAAKGLLATIRGKR